MSPREEQLVEFMNHYASRLLYVAREIDHLPDWRLLAERDLDEAEALLRKFRAELVVRREKVAA